jgi:hypothetical protein
MARNWREHIFAVKRCAGGGGARTGLSRAEQDGDELPRPGSSSPREIQMGQWDMFPLIEWAAVPNSRTGVLRTFPSTKNFSNTW